MKNALIGLLCCASLITGGTLLAQEETVPSKPDGDFDKAGGPPQMMGCKGGRGGQMPGGKCAQMGDCKGGPGGQMMPPGAQMGEHRGGPGAHHGMRDGGNNPMMDIEIDNPEKAKELKALAESNPAEFKEKMKAAVTEMQAKRKADMDEFKKLVEQYMKKPDDAVKSKIREKLVAQLDRKIKVEEMMLAKKQEKVMETQKRIELQKSKKDVMVNLKLEEMLRDPSLRW
ncbi:MAG: hypothetical protein A2017_19255 [Lentisphaerae bacterium GWF2_44_16]|nr:MAG: hypothetical protein A2017_19255 [Lentisphaerae bacterium GWF2_44_16]